MRVSVPHQTRFARVIYLVRDAKLTSEGEMHFTLTETVVSGTEDQVRALQVTVEI